MTYFTSLYFVYQFILVQFNLNALIWSLIAFLISLFGLHLGWGKLWNNDWTTFKQPAAATLSFILAIVIFGSVLLYNNANNSIQWLDYQRSALIQDFVSSGLHNRHILIATCEQLKRNCNVADNTLTLNDAQDVEALATVAAKEIRCPLVNFGPLRTVPCSLRDPTAVATEVMRTVPITSYPIIISPQNSWSEAAMTAQIQYAMNYITQEMHNALSELKHALLSLIVLIMVIQAMMVPMFAIKDISIYPNVSRETIV